MSSTDLNRVAVVTFSFWVMKICATTLGETAGDLLSMTLNVGYAASSLILIGAFLATLVAQLSAKSFHPALYWSVILSTSTAGTTMSDYIDRSLGMGYVAGSAMLVAILITILTVWRFNVGSLQVSSIKTFKVEAFYWAAILVSNTLGTALGDFLADSSGLGFAGGALLIASLIGLIVLAYFFTSISRTGLFWIAFVLTRPLGATMGDLLTKPLSHGGLGFGTIGSSAVLFAVLVGCVIMVMRKASLAKANTAG